MTLRNLSLFTGSGIGDLAALSAGITTVAKCENDPVCQYALRKLWPDAYLFEDVHDVSAQSLRQRGLWPIDIISGGFPCQNISTSGRGEGIEGSRSCLWREMFRVIRQVRPAWLVIENVPVIRVRGVDRVLAPLERIGYACWPLVAGAWSVGAPHKRDRVWIVARLQSDGCGQGWPGRLDSSDERQQQRALQDMDNTTGNRQPGDRHVRSGSARPIGATEAESLATGGGDDGESLRELADRPRQPREQRPDRDGVGIPRECDECNASGIGGCDRWGTCDRFVADTGSLSSGRRPPEPGRGPIKRIATRWPSRPGEPQHEWERPRLVEFGMGQSVDGMARRIHSKANKSMLRILGNGWVYPIPQIIYRWIAEQEQPNP